MDRLKQRHTEGAQSRLISRLILLLSAPLSLCSCGVTMSAHEATRILIDQLTREEVPIMRVCRALDAQTPSQLRALIDDPDVSTTLKAELLHEARSTLGVLFTSIGVSQVCDGGAVIDRHLNIQGASDQTACEEALTSRLASLKPARGDTRGGEGGDALNSERPKSDRSESVLGVAEALLATRVTPRQLIEDPLSVARALDLSSAAVSATLSIADQADRLVQRVASLAPVGGGLARVVINKLAAEMIASTLEGLLDTLEAQQLLNRSSVSRQACALYRRAESRPAVTTRLIKRMILRFDVSAQTHSPWLEICENRESLCTDMLEDIQVAKPQLPFMKLPPSTVREALTPRAPQRDLSASALAAQVAQDSALLGRVAQACRASRDGCSLSELSARAGALRQLEYSRSLTRDGDRREVKLISELSSPSTLSAQGMISEIKSQQLALKGEVQTLRGELAQAREQLSAVTELSRAQSAVAARSMRLLGLILSERRRCREVMDRVKRARSRFASDLLGIEARDGLCDGSSEEMITARRAGLTEVKISRLALCDPLSALTFEVNISALFKSCSDVPEAPERHLEALVTLVQALKGSQVTLTGHSDQEPLTLSCRDRFPDNVALSRSRAHAVSGYITTRLKALGVVINEPHVSALGASSPLEDCERLDIRDQARCHAGNRRVTASFQEHADLSFNAQSCAP